MLFVVIIFIQVTKIILINLLNNKNFELIRHDITFPIYLEVDEIFNFACPASPVHYQNDPVQTIKTCVHGAINMLGLAKELKLKLYKLLHQKFMVILKFILKQKNIKVL